jgi:hypothetical protein
MAKVTIENGGAGAVIRAALNDMFTEIYAKLVAAAADADGYLTKEDWATFNGKQDTLVAATAEADGYLTKEDFATFLAKQDALSAATAAVDGYLKKEDFDTFNKKQAALTDPLCLVAAPATAGSTGTKGQWAQDGTYIYLCTATDTWVRAAVAFATWGEE